jgi:hypothetical protein
MALKRLMQAMATISAERRRDKEPAAPAGRQWAWASGHSADSIKRAADGYEPTLEAAMAAFAKSWRKG